LWERWSPPRAAGAEAPAASPGKSPEKSYVDSFTIVTTDANERLKPLHHRMPVILAAEHYARWLDPDAVPDELTPLLRPAPDDLLQFVPIDRRANNVRNDDAELLRRQEPAAT